MIDVLLAFAILVHLLQPTRATRGAPDLLAHFFQSASWMPESRTFRMAAQISPSSSSEMTNLVSESWENITQIYFAADPKNHTWVVTPLHLVGWSSHNLRTNVSSLSSGCGCKLPTHSAQVLRRQPCHVEWFMIHTISTKNKINNEPTELKELS